MFYIKKEKLKLIIICFLLSIIHIFPYIFVDNLTGDVGRYQKDFRNISINPVGIWPEFGIESGFYWLGYVLSKISFTFHLYLFFIAFFFYYYSSLLIEKELRSRKNYIIIYVLMIFIYPIYFAYDSFLNVVLRQAIVVIIFWKFYFPVYDRSLKSCILIVGFACFFHLSAIIYFFIYYLLRTIKKDIYYVLFFLLSLFLYVFEIPLYFAEFIRTSIKSIFFFKSDLAIFSFKEHVKLGFSLLKFLVIVMPFLGYLLVNKSRSLLGKDMMKVWNIYFFISSLGMLMSGLAYHDRIMLYAWSWIPLLSLPFLESMYNSFRRTL